ncbi:unnamed protein product [Cylindrotheca closterium]|uniref:Rhodanese domain-containing protein n=1 Tax=Cylindrotheca closterium TaxID=2856 RepID=A0AAD2FP45_9STRA|nr:unnamed protein product [Cylindrotheca closterium]
MLTISQLTKKLSTRISLAKTPKTTNLATTTSRLLSSKNKKMSIAKPDDIKKSLANKSTILLDVRTMDEIEASGKIEVEGNQWLQTVCTPSSTDMDLNTDDIDKETDIIIYCRSGRRASRAKEILEGRGFKNVLNGGGYDDMKSMGL